MNIGLPAVYSRDMHSVLDWMDGGVWQACMKYSSLMMLWCFGEDL